MGRHSKKIKTIISFIIIFGLTFAVGSFLGGQLNKGPKESIQSRQAKGKIINILFMGIDARNAKDNSRSDTMILASIDSKTKKVALLSIPRDTRIVNARGHSEKINGVNYIEGPEAACEVVSDLLDTEVDHYVVTNFAGFGKIVDILGGVDIDVEDDMNHDDVSYSIHLSEGYQHLNGDKALQYVRYRGGPTADIGRTQRQQKFIKALAKQMFQAKTILKLPQLLPQINKNVNTNIPMSDMIYLAKMAREVDTSKMTSQTLPGYPYTDPGSGASYWEADKDTAKMIVSSLLKGKTFPMVGDPPSWIDKERKKYTPVDLPTPETIQQQEEVPTENTGTNGENTETPPTQPSEGDDGVIDPGASDPGTTNPGTTNPGEQQPPDGNSEPPEQLPPGDTDPGSSGDGNNDVINQTYQ